MKKFAHVEDMLRLLSLELPSKISFQNVEAAHAETQRFQINNTEILSYIA